MTDTRDGWTHEDATALRLSRVGRGDSQLACANELRTLGAAKVSQAAVSEWERAVSAPQAAAHAAIRDYIRQYPTTVSLPTKAGATSVPVDMSWAFDKVSRDIVGEPLLGHRQGALIDAIAARLASGPAMSTADLSAFEMAAKLVRLPAAASGEPPTDLSGTQGDD